MSVAAETPSRGSGTGGLKLAALSVLALFVSGVGWWAATVSMPGAVVARGQIVAEGRSKPVRSLEGGQIAAVHVREGAHVAEGDLLVVLDPTRQRTALQALQRQRGALLASFARLEAEANGEERVAFPAELLSVADAEIQDAVRLQERLFRTRAESRRARDAAARQKVEELRHEIDEHVATARGLERQLVFLREELGTARGLLAKGIGLKPRVLNAERAVADAEAGIAAARAREARAREGIAEVRLAADADLRTRLDEVGAEMADVRARLGAVDAQIESARDLLQRTEVRAAATGTVFGIKYPTAGAVAGAGEDLMRISPDGVPLQIEAVASPNDSDGLREGQTAEIVLLPYSQRRTPKLQGRIAVVSPDAVMDEKTNTAGFRIVADVLPESLAALPKDVRMVPGMPVELYAQTDERTVLEYLMSPVLMSFQRSFRED